jgi:apolipoprotein D and lipocalin family protein
VRHAIAIGCAFAILAAAGRAGAAAPRPIKSVGLNLYTGRWYQVGQIVKTNNHPCPGGTDDFAPNANGRLTVTIACRSGRRISAGVTILPGSGNTRFRMSFFGGLIRQEYWLLNYATDQSWALMATPGGNYLWLLARRPTLDPATRARALASIKALGYDPARLTPSQ